MENERLQEAGRRIRFLRQRRGITLRALSRQCGLSTGFLSQIERGLSSFSVPSLRSICQALGVSLADILVMSNGPGKAFLADPRPATITKGDSRAFVNLSNASINYRFLSAGLSGRRFEALVGEMGPGSICGPRVQEGEEFGYVLEGALKLSTEEETHELGSGDSYHVLASSVHACEACPVGATVLWIQTTPPQRILRAPNGEMSASDLGPVEGTRGGIVADGGGTTPVNLSGSAVRYRFLSGGQPEARLQVVLAEIPNGYEPGPKSFDGEEFGYVLNGRLHLVVGEDSYVLEAGDCYHLPPASHQAYRTDEEAGARVLWAQMEADSGELEHALQGVFGGRSSSSEDQ